MFGLADAGFSAAIADAGFVDAVFGLADTGFSAATNDAGFVNAGFPTSTDANWPGPRGLLERSLAFRRRFDTHGFNPVSTRRTVFGVGLVAFARSSSKRYPIISSLPSLLLSEPFVKDENASQSRHVER